MQNNKARLLSSRAPRGHIQSIYQENNHNSASRGALGERLARVFLEKKGYRCIERNAHTHWGEIDLVMRRGHVTVFVEVKTRTNRRFGDPEDAFDRKKRTTLLRAIEWYCLDRGISSFQVDLVAIERVGCANELRHYPNVEIG